MSSSVHATEDLLFSVLVQLIVMIGAARAMHLVARRLGQPGAIGEIVAGLMLGPSLLGSIAPDLSVTLFGAKPAESVTVLSQIGLTLLMFQIGASFEFGHLKDRRYRRAASAIAATSLLVPLALGFAIGLASANRLAPDIDRITYSLFVAVALAITALPILGRILVQFGLERHPVGVVAIAAAAVNDLIGWVLLAMVSAYAAALLSINGAVLQLGGLVVLALVARYALVPLADRLVRRWPVVGGDLSPTLIALVLAIIFALAIATFKLGVFAIFGGFLAGTLFHRHAAFVEAWRRQIGVFVLVFFLPIFFTFTGLRTDVFALSGDLDWLAIVLAAAILGKVVPVYVAARATGFSGAEASTLGALMNTRALMELIVLNVGYELGFLPPSMFAMLVVMAVVTTLMTGPLLRLLLPRMGHHATSVAEA
ncbi:MAG: cation:proton antiporter [Pseudomonadota bacterium]